ncbi:MAG TPA: beta-propeller fold lactonase family protein [Terriglobia bacterium]|nr:beta-propeller fold lactonase family protein [Terriglobia bacterium]
MTGMTGRIKNTLLAAGIISVFGLASSLTLRNALAQDDAATTGAVYTMTNASANQVMAFTRHASGSLALLGTFSTQGSGNSLNLTSQGAVILNSARTFLFVVNPGSNTITSFSVQSNGSLVFVNQVSSGGTEPVSVTSHSKLVYVVNAKGSPNISGFTVATNGSLTPLAGSTVGLSATTANPAEVAFNNSGTLLVVTEKSTNKIDTFTVGSNGIASGPMVQDSNGPQPFGFAFDSNDHLIVSETTNSAVSSYSVATNGVLTVITGSLLDGAKAACWIANTNNHTFPNQYSYTTNTGSANVSGYSIAANGSLTLLAGKPTGTPKDDLDMALSTNSMYLYVLGRSSGQIQGYSVASTGALAKVGAAVTVPTTSYGLASF